MTREIKFRFWNDIEKKMFYPSQDSLDNPYYIKSSGMIFDVSQAEKKSDFLSPFLIIPLQFTGMKDKEGREIYEGDIIKEKYEEDIIIIRFGITNCNCCDSVIGYRDVNCDCKIIGNIYENPELVEEIS